MEKKPESVKGREIGLFFYFFRQTELHRVRFKVTGQKGHSDRKMPAQPNVFKGNDGKVSRYNLRKFAELPFHLIGSARTVDLCDHVLFNYYWLHAKISAVPILNILEDFTRALSLIHDPPLRRQVQAQCLKMTQNVAFEFWHFPPIFDLLKLTCLVTLFDRKL